MLQMKTIHCKNLKDDKENLTFHWVYMENITLITSKEDRTLNLGPWKKTIIFFTWHDFELPQFINTTSKWFED